MRDSKLCTKCGEVKSLSAFYTRKRNGKESCEAGCKECKRLIDSEYRKNNKDKLRAKNKKWREENKDWVYAYQKEYRKKNTDKHNYWNRKSYYNNHDKNKLVKKNSSKNYYTQHPDVFRNGIKELKNWYIKALLVQGSALSKKDITKELIEAKRAQIQILRLCQQ